MTDPAVEEKAEELYVIKGFSMDTILSMLDGQISRKTLYNIRKKNNWEDKRRDRIIRTQNRRERLEAALDRLLDEFETKPDPKLIFSIGKLVGALKSSSTFEFTEEKKEKEENKNSTGISDKTIARLEELMGG